MGPCWVPPPRHHAVHLAMIGNTVGPLVHDVPNKNPQFRADSLQRLLQTKSRRSLSMTILVQLTPASVPKRSCGDNSTTSAAARRRMEPPPRIPTRSNPTLALDSSHGPTCIAYKSSRTIGNEWRSCDSTHASSSKTPSWTPINALEQEPVHPTRASGRCFQSRERPIRLRRQCVEHRPRSHCPQTVHEPGLSAIATETATAPAVASRSRDRANVP